MNIKTRLKEISNVKVRNRGQFTRSILDPIDDYAKKADQGWSDLDLVFAMILYATNVLFGKL